MIARLLPLAGAGAVIVVLAPLVLRRGTGRHRAAARGAGLLHDRGQARW